MVTQTLCSRPTAGAQLSGSYCHHGKKSSKLSSARRRFFSTYIGLQPRIFHFCCLFIYPGHEGLRVFHQPCCGTLLSACQLWKCMHQSWCGKRNHFFLNLEENSLGEETVLTAYLFVDLGFPSVSFHSHVGLSPKWAGKTGTQPGAPPAQHSHFEQKNERETSPVFIWKCSN